MIWALSTRADLGRASMIVENAPIDYLDFAKPAVGPGGKLVIDATAKIPPESLRPWGRRIEMEP